LQNSSELIRRPFFLDVSVAAVVFVVSPVQPPRRNSALRWGCRSCSGALGNLTDRVVRTSVIHRLRADGLPR
jgi:signal peptidase II